MVAMASPSAEDLIEIALRCLKRALKGLLSEVFGGLGAAHVPFG